MIAKRIKALREAHGLTQADIAREMGITRSSVNAWEMGISFPSVMYVIKLAGLFQVSTDYILGVGHETILDVSGIDEDGVRILIDMIRYIRDRQG